MRNKLILFGAMVLVFLLIGAIALTYLLGGDSGSAENASDNPFGDTSQTRTFPNSSTVNEDLFNTYGKNWVPNKAAQSLPNVAFRLLYEKPVSGAAAVTLQTASGPSPVVRFVERERGTALERSLTDTTEPRTLSTRTILGAAEAQWSGNGSSTLIRYLDDAGESAQAYLALFDRTTSTTTSATSQGRPLPNNIVAAAASPDGRSLFYIVATQNGSTGYIENTDTGARMQAWSSPLRGLTASWTTPNTLVVYTNPTQAAIGSLWTIDRTKYTARLALSKQVALAGKTNTTGTKILYSLFEGQGGVWSLRVLDIPSGKVSYLPMPTVAEKCVWGTKWPNYVYCAVPRDMTDPMFVDHWYQGLIQTQDILWRFDTETGTSKQILDPFLITKSEYDMTDLSVTQDEDYLTFVNRSDLRLWGVQLPKDREAASSTPAQTQ